MNPSEYATMFAVEDRHWWYVGLRREILRAAERVHAQSSGAPGRWLDAGCGTGGLLARLHAAAPTSAPGPWWPVGVDISADGVAFSRRRGMPRVLQGSVSALPFADSVFDIVTSIDVLYHARVDEERAVREMRRVLKPGGWLIVHVPAFEWLRSEHDAAIWTRRRYTRRQAVALLEGAGLQVRTSFYRNQLLFPSLALIRLTRRRHIDAQRAVSDLTALPGWLNAMLRMILYTESSLPEWMRQAAFGLSIFCVAQRPLASGERA